MEVSEFSGRFCGCLGGLGVFLGVQVGFCGVGRVRLRCGVEGGGVKGRGLGICFCS